MTLLHLATHPQESLIETTSINACRRSVLVVERDTTISSFYVRVFKNRGYAVRTAVDAQEALRLYKECAPFSIVLINYWLLPINQVFIDCGSSQTNGLVLAKDIRDMNPSQSVIFAAYDYATEEDFRRKELLDIPMMIDVRELNSLMEKFEIERAIEQLTPNQLQKLQRYASFRVRGLGRAARGRTGEDLLQQAELATLAGVGQTGDGRRWNRDVDFFRHLIGAMRSISNSWKRTFDEIEAHLESELLTFDSEGRTVSPLDHTFSERRTAEQDLIAREKLQQIFRTFANDPKATWVLQGCLDGLKRAAIIQKYGLTPGQYAAAEKRIRINLSRDQSGANG